MPESRNQLVGADPWETLDRCRDALTMATRVHDPVDEPSVGLRRLLASIDDALLFEQQARRPWTTRWDDEY
ncbi:MAG: hypothetical protein WCA32_19905 [Chromatiaceae bacterium]|jgi:hypothetical protein